MRYLFIILLAGCITAPEVIMPDDPDFARLCETPNPAPGCSATSVRMVIQNPWPNPVVPACTLVLTSRWTTTRITNWRGVPALSTLSIWDYAFMDCPSNYDPLTGMPR